MRANTSSASARRSVRLAVSIRLFIAVICSRYPMRKAIRLPTPPVCSLGRPPAKPGTACTTRPLCTAWPESGSAYPGLLNLMV